MHMRGAAMKITYKPKLFYHKMRVLGRKWSRNVNIKTISPKAKHIAPGS